jgi:SH3-like domain-containing protein
LPCEDTEAITIIQAQEEEFMKKVIGLSILSACFIVGAVLPAQPGTARAKCIGKDKVNIRSGPSLQSGIISHAPLGYPIEIEKEKGDWIFFKDWENNTGWVYKNLVSDLETAVILVNANVRSAAGKRHKVIAKARRGDIYKMIGREGNWVRLGYFFGDEPFGWIRSDLVFGD